MIYTTGNINIVSYVLLIIGTFLIGYSSLIIHFNKTYCMCPNKCLNNTMYSNCNEYSNTQINNGIYMIVFGIIGIIFSIGFCIKYPSDI